jgi:hypothetical protein
MVMVHTRHFDVPWYFNFNRMCVVSRTEPGFNAILHWVRKISGLSSAQPEKRHPSKCLESSECLWMCIRKPQTYDFTILFALLWLLKLVYFGVRFLASAEDKLESTAPAKNCVIFN